MLPRPHTAGAHAEVLELPIPRADFCPSKHASEPVRPSPGSRRAVSHGHAPPSAARDDPFRRLATTRRVIALATQERSAGTAAGERFATGPIASSATLRATTP